MGSPRATPAWRTKLRSHLLRALTFAICSALLAAGVERWLETRDAARLMPGQTFVSVTGSQVRYRVLGREHTGTPVVFLSGLNGSIEQLEHLQRGTAKTHPTLVYDRAGYGFSKNSRAHTAAEQADELAGVLHALKLEQPVVIVAYSLSAQLARLYASRFPERTAGLYLIEPTAPEIDALLPGRDGPTRRYLRFIVTSVISSTFGLSRLRHKLRPEIVVDSPLAERAAAILDRAPHAWAVATELLVGAESSRQTLAAVLPPRVPVEIAYCEIEHPDETARVAKRVYEAMVRRSQRGRLHPLPEVDHAQLSSQGPVLTAMLGHIEALANGAL